jgi:hypothetical protein
MEELRLKLIEDVQEIEGIDFRKSEELRRYFHDTAIATRLPIDHAKAMAYDSLTQTVTGTKDVTDRLTTLNLLRAIALIDYITEAGYR